MPLDELCAWLRLTLTPGVGNDSARRLLQSFGLPQKIFTQNLATLRSVVSATQAQALQTEPPDLPALLTSTQQWLATPGHHVISLADADYPPALLQCADPPLMLYMLASNKSQALAAMADVPKSLAMVGSRNPTAQGLASAKQFAQDLCATGVHVVSGMALGVDGAAHEGALMARTGLETHSKTRSGIETINPRAGLTIAVIGTGLDRVYPRQHRDLAHRIAQHGAIISEFPLGTPPLAHNFPKRNRIIAALSRATLVVEAALQSGSLITARCALDMGKDVLAIPGSIHSPQSRGCHSLIKQGAKLVETAQDVLEELCLNNSPITTKMIAAYADSTPGNGQNDLENLGLSDGHDRAKPGANEAPILRALGFAPTHLDALVERTGESAALLQAKLMELELQGLVARLPGGLYQRQGLA